MKKNSNIIGLICALALVLSASMVMPMQHISKLLKCGKKFTQNCYQKSKLFGKKNYGTITYFAIPTLLFGSQHENYIKTEPNGEKSIIFKQALLYAIPPLKCCALTMKLKGLSYIITKNKFINEKVTQYFPKLTPQKLNELFKNQKTRAFLGLGNAVSISIFYYGFNKIKCS